MAYPEDFMKLLKAILASQLGGWVGGIMEQITMAPGVNLPTFFLLVKLPATLINLQL